MRLLILSLLLLSTFYSQAQTADDFVFETNSVFPFSTRFTLYASGAVTIDWGDGQSSSFSNFADITKNYSTGGNYTVVITGNIEQIWFDTNNAINITQWGTSQWQSMVEMFKDCNKLSITASVPPDMTLVTSTFSMFENAGNGSSNSVYNIGNWDVSNVTDMAYMFANAREFNSNLSSWDVSNVTSMFAMFDGATNFNSDLSSWDVSSVSNIVKMFANALEFNSDISSWDVSNVPNMSYMFENATNFNSDISNWDVSNVTDMSNMFNSATNFNSDISNWNVSNVTDMSKMFEGATNFNSDISNWDVSNVTDMSNMFDSATNFNSDISSWDVSNVPNMTRMFFSATNFNSDISNWDVSNVTNMTRMFYSATNFNSDISNWDVSNVTNMTGMFSRASVFNSDLSSWDVSNVTDMAGMFGSATNFNSDLSSWDVSSVTEMSGMFYDATNFNSDLSSWDVSNVTSMFAMFESATNFNSDLSSWDVSNVTEMVAMFYQATSFNQDLSSWNFSGLSSTYFPLEEAFDLSGLDYINYDKLLARLVNLNIRNLDLGAQGLEYCDTFSRDILIQRRWNILGDSQFQNCPNNDLRGTIYFDLDNNGCDASDLLVPNTAVEISDGTNSIFVYSDNDGVYATNLPDGTYTLTPIIDSSLFNGAPVAPSVTLSNTATVSQDFCLTAVAPIDDLEVSILPLEEARPGFDTNYKLIYKNKGNTQLTGNLSITYEDDFMDFLAATPATSSSSVGTLNWDFVDLNPFETREIEFSMNLNTPTDPAFALNSDDQLNFNAVISPTTSDSTPLDNVFDLEQIVVNSYDPNDKTCLQGNVIAPEMVGEFVHYRIRFENEGTASAVNVRIVDYIDLAKFDITTLTPLSSSHDYTAKITEGNKVEFIFDDIQLPFTAPASQGYVLFKIKTLDTLVLGDDFSNQAEIYFDFNFPIITNLETTAVDVTASVADHLDTSFKMIPNPASNQVQLSAQFSFNKVTVFDSLGNLILIKQQGFDATSASLDISTMASGLYFVQIDGGSQGATQKLIVK